MRVLHYSHDYHRMDNLQRMLKAAEQVALEFPDATQLLVTGSPQPSEVRLPKRVDYIKLPIMPELGEKEAHSPYISQPSATIRTLHETLISNTIQGFQPDVMLVEAPENEQKEIFYELNHLEQKKIVIKVVLGNGDFKNTATMIRDAIVAKENDKPSRGFATAA